MSFGAPAVCLSSAPCLLPRHALAKLKETTIPGLPPKPSPPSSASSPSAALAQHVRAVESSPSPQVHLCFPVRNVIEGYKPLEERMCE